MQNCFFFFLHYKVKLTRENVKFGKTDRTTNFVYNNGEEHKKIND